jgi:ferredoxin
LPPRVLVAVLRCPRAGNFAMTSYSAERTMERYRIAVNTERCTGCGACIEACPTGALYLVAGKAAADNALCRGCEACVNICPEGALSLAARPEATTPPIRPAAQPLTRQPEPEVLRIRTESSPVPWRARVLPVVGAALAWAGREIVPRMVDVVLDRFDRQAEERQMAARGRRNQASSQGAGGKGRRHRHRRRGGR